MTIAVDSVLVGAGVATGLVQAAPTLAAGWHALAALTARPQGENAVVAAAGLREPQDHGDQRHTGPADGVEHGCRQHHLLRGERRDHDDQIYTGTPNPPTNNNLTLVTSIIVPIPLGDTTWTATGGNITFAESSVVPSSLTVPTGADKTAAPLQILPKINGLINVPFYCWNGTASADGLTLIPVNPGNAIDTVVVNTPPTAPVCGLLNKSVGGGQSTTVDLTSVCHDANGDGTINWATLGIGFGNPASPTICSGLSLRHHGWHLEPHRHSWCAHLHRTPTRTSVRTCSGSRCPTQGG